MDAGTLQPAGSGPLLIHPVPTSFASPPSQQLLSARPPDSSSHARNTRRDLSPRQLVPDERDGLLRPRSIYSSNVGRSESGLLLRPPTASNAATLATLDCGSHQRVAAAAAANHHHGPPEALARTVSELCEKGQVSEAVDALGALVQHTEWRCVSVSLFYRVLKSCMAQKNLLLGRRVHELAVQAGCDSNTFLANHILRMYTSHGKLEEAKKVFTRLAKPDAFSWSAVLTGHVKNGEPKQAVELYHQMMRGGSNLKPDNHVFVAALQACVGARDLESGRQVHADMLESGIPPDLYVWNCLIDMYAKCDTNVESARQVFDSMPTKDVVTWTTMIAGYADHGLGHHALATYNTWLEQQQEQGLVPANVVTFACLLRACATVCALQQGRHFHSQILERGLESDVLLINSLIDMYVKCGRVDEARRVFDCAAAIRRDVVSWNTMMTGYAENGLDQECLALYARMKQEGTVVANNVTFACLLKACASVGALLQGKHLHSEIQERGLEADVVVSNSLLSMYAKCGRLGEARQVFDSLSSKKDSVTWASMIAGYADGGHVEEALALYDIMQQQQEGPHLCGPATFSSLVKACANAGAIEQGRQLHLQIVERGLESELVVGTCLVDMYAKCGSLEDAVRVFESLPTRNVVTYNTMISGYTRYGRLEDAQRLFDSLADSRDVVTCNAMIAGYAEYGLFEQALDLVRKMEQDYMLPADSSTFVSLLKACATSAALQQGKQLHGMIVERRLGSDTLIGTCLIDMYSKCGGLDEARRIFDDLPAKDVVSWNAMINGFAQSNDGHRAIGCFQEMTQAGVPANETTFTCLLVACSHEGLVREGLQFFKAMAQGYGIVPTVDHHNCMVDLLGRAGRLDEAQVMLLSCESNEVGYRSLLNACKSHGDVERGRWCFENLVKLDAQNAAAYVLMGNIYADAGRWAEVEKIETLRKLAGAKKKPAVAGIEVNRQVFTFLVGEEKGDVSCKVRNMSTQLKERGHAPRTGLVLKQVSEGIKEEELCGHAEKLALAYGLMNTPDGTSLLLTKNLRMCGDCHSSTEIVSKVENREIIVRDAHRLHRFVDGSCCCGGRP